MTILLLTDQRTPEQKAAYAAVEQYRKAYPELAGIWENLMPRDNTMLEALVLDGEVFYTPTGRIVYPDAIKPARQQGKTTYTVSCRLDDIDAANLEMAFFGTDFASIEDRILHTLQRKRDYQLEMYALGALYGTRFEDVAAEPEVKQNGRSASYLKHDKTKNHRRRRR